MINCYIDESGSMTKKYAKSFPFFVICIINVLDASKLKHLYKTLFIKDKSLFVKSNDNKYELKGARLTKEQKVYLANYFNRPGLLEVFYIKVINENLNNDQLYCNKARAFNYLIAKDFEHLFIKKLLFYDEYFLYIDNRNIKNDSKKSLEDYLNIKLSFENYFATRFRAQYYDSKNVKLIQIADFFSNLFYSDLITSNYECSIVKLIKNRVIKDIFIFPL